MYLLLSRTRLPVGKRNLSVAKKTIFVGTQGTCATGTQGLDEVQRKHGFVFQHRKISDWHS